jgi:hypothetical protein
MSRLAAWTFPLTVTRVIAITAFLAVASFFFSAMIDRVLIVSGSASRCFTMMYITNLLLSLLVGLLFWTRSLYLRKRLEVIAGLNHDIRNALYVISLSMYLEVPNVKIIKDSVERIDRALREFVPHGEMLPIAPRKYRSPGDPLS